MNTKKCKVCGVDIFDAEHPYRQIAGAIIDNIIEPQFNRDHCIKGAKYFDLEDELTELINKYDKEIRKNIR